MDFTEKELEERIVWIYKKCNNNKKMRNITHIINEKIIYCPRCGGHGHRMMVVGNHLVCRGCGYEMPRNGENYSNEFNFKKPKDKIDHSYEIICLNCNSKFYEPIKICETCGIEFQIEIKKGVV